MIRHLIAVGLSVLCAFIAASASASAAAPAPAAPTGLFKNVTLPERSPLSSIEESFRRTPRQFTGTKLQTIDDMSARERALLDYDLSKESVDVVVPGTARDGSPQGLFVWLGVTQPDAEWFGALSRHRLIYVTPNNSYGRSPWIKRGLAIDAVHNLHKRYPIDPARVYVSGFSAGAHASARLVVQFPDVFHGALCLMGGPYYQTTMTPPPAGAGRAARPRQESTVLGPTWFGDVERLKRDLRLVSVYGGDDDTCPPAQGRADHESLRLDGFRHTYIELPGHGHNHPDFSAFDRALSALDSDRAPQPPPPTTAPIKGTDRPHPDQLAQAARLLRTAAMVYDRVSRLSSRPPATTQQLAADNPAYDIGVARRCLTDLLANYPSTPSAAEARALLAKLDALYPPVPAPRDDSSTGPAK